MTNHADGLNEETKAVYRAAVQLLGSSKSCSDEEIAEATGYDTGLVRDRLLFLGSDYVEIKPRDEGHIDVLSISNDPPQLIV